MKGLEVSGHRRRTLSHEILDRADVVIAMSLEHKSTLQCKFQTISLLFTEACGGLAEPLLDVDDLFAPEDRYTSAAQRHIYSIIDQIVEQTPALANRVISGWRPSP